ncbi:hypothetical protein SAMN05216216_12731, partial [Lacicoccus qingdaonensis]
QLEGEFVVPPILGAGRTQSQIGNRAGIIGPESKEVKRNEAVTSEKSHKKWRFISINR